MGSLLHGRLLRFASTLAAFALLLVFGVGQVLGPTPDSEDKTASQLASAYAAFVQDKDHRTGTIIGGILLAFAALALVWFVATVRERFALPAAAQGFGVLAAAGIGMAMLGPLAMVGGYAFGDEPLPTNGDVVWAVYEFGLPALLVLTALALAAFLIVWITTARGTLPIWLVVFGWLAVLGCATGLLFITMLVPMVFFLVAGIWGAVTGGPAETDAAITS